MNVDTDLALPLNKAKTIEKCTVKQLKTVSGPRLLNDPDFPDRVITLTREIRETLLDAEPNHPLEEPILQYIQRVSVPALRWI